VTVSNHQRLRRATPVLALAVVAFVVGAAFGAAHGGSPAYALANQFVGAWTRGDYATMYSDIDTTAQAHTSVNAFANDYQQALRTATATSVRIAGRARSVADDEVEVPVRVRTRLWGTLELDYTLRISEDGSAGERVGWSRSLAFPGLRAGELLSRRTYLPPRAELLARDGSVLAESLPEPSSDDSLPTEQTRNSPLGAAAEAVLGNVGPIPTAHRQALEEQGVPAQAIVGVSGLELALDERLRGTPGGELLAGARLLAYATPRPAPALRTTVSPALQNAVVTGLGAQLGGVVAMQPSTGQILAVAGLGLDGLQPPGSTFKMVTLTGVLQAHVATPSTVFPYATYATLDGVKLNNANGEECGGSLALAFAVSCNSVFTPLGVKLGAPRLVGTAERYGFNHESGVPGAAESTLPPASHIQGELDVGSTAIGQGEVLATPLEMATVAATIADGGRRPQPTFLTHTTTTAGVQVTSASVARTVRRLMIGVVREGTGTSAAIPGVTVAGKTGTAELKAACTSSSTETSPSESSSEPPKETCQGNETEASNTDAWFAAFAPALDPKIVVCVLLVKDGAGGDTAAPVARGIIETALQDGD
jgi:peptidoglycan glycosyltransferase